MYNFPLRKKKLLYERNGALQCLRESTMVEWLSWLINFIAQDGFYYLIDAANMDPYVILTCRTQEKKSSVASGELHI